MITLALTKLQICHREIVMCTESHSSDLGKTMQRQLLKHVQKHAQSTKKEVCRTSWGIIGREKPILWCGLP